MTDENESALGSSARCPELLAKTRHDEYHDWSSFVSIIYHGNTHYRKMFMVLSIESAEAQRRTMPKQA
jgi:hypothetical protein